MNLQREATSTMNTQNIENHKVIECKLSKQIELSNNDFISKFKQWQMYVIIEEHRHLFKNMTMHNSPTQSFQFGLCIFNAAKT